jgi:hypothetical protein
LADKQDVPNASAFRVVFCEKAGATVARVEEGGLGGRYGGDGVGTGFFDVGCRGGEDGDAKVLTWRGVRCLALALAMERLRIVQLLQIWVYTLRLVCTPFSRITGAHLLSIFFGSGCRERGTITSDVGVQFLVSFLSYSSGYRIRCIFALSDTGTFFGRCVESIGAIAASAATVSVLAYRRHLVALYVIRGTAARVQDMAVDIGVMGCRDCPLSKLQKLMELM